MSSLYAVTQNQMLQSEFDWLVGTYSVMLVPAAYVPNFATDATLADIGTHTLIATPANLSSLSVSGGFAVSGSLNLGTITTGSAVAAIVILKNNGGAQSTWQLVAYIDQGIGFGAIVSNIPVQIIFDARGIFQA